MGISGDITGALRLRFGEMERCTRRECYWALLHLTVVLPDLCAALEAEDGEAAPPRYIRWCKQHSLADAIVNAEEWYEIRCVVLHQGRTLPERGRYGAFRFNYPGGPHKKTRPPENPTDWPDAKHHLDLDTAKMAEEVRSAIRRWIGDLEQQEQRDGAAARVLNVRKYLRTVARLDVPIGLGAIDAASSGLVAGHTSYSTIIAGGDLWVVRGDEHP